METIEIAGKQYTVTDCWCGGQPRHDSTNADKVATGGNTSTQCSHCYRGTGKIYKLVVKLAADPVREVEPIGDIPDWML